MSFYPFDSFGFFLCKPSMVPMLGIWYCCVWPAPGDGPSNSNVFQAELLWFHLHHFTSFLPKVWHGWMSVECLTQIPPAYLVPILNSSPGAHGDIFFSRSLCPRKKNPWRSSWPETWEKRCAIHAFAELLLVGDAPLWAHKRFLVFCMLNIGVWGFTVVLFSSFFLYFNSISIDIYIYIYILYIYIYVCVCNSVYMYIMTYNDT